MMFRKIRFVMKPFFSSNSSYIETIKGNIHEGSFYFFIIAVAADRAG